MIFFTLVCYLFLYFETASAEQWHRKATIESHEHFYSPSNNKTEITVSSITECSQKCFYAGSSCVGANFQIDRIKGRHSCELAYYDERKENLVEKTGWIYLQPIEKVKKTLEVKAAICAIKFSPQFCIG